MTAVTVSNRMQRFRAIRRARNYLRRWERTPYITERAKRFEEILI